MEFDREALQGAAIDDVHDHEVPVANGRGADVGSVGGTGAAGVDVCVSHADKSVLLNPAGPEEDTRTEDKTETNAPLSQHVFSSQTSSVGARVSII